MKIEGLYIDPNRLFKRPSFKWNILAPEHSQKEFIKLFEMFLKDIKGFEK